ncbi:hypothetical protein, partial [Ornithinicoccus halotolerans]|uniref:hypothetical protein n=1 Tax=Ornithinicoccus halotolerans TaxID=1748220 RepID=UPI001E4473AA
ARGTELGCVPVHPGVGAALRLLVLGISPDSHPEEVLAAVLAERSRRERERAAARESLRARLLPPDPLARPTEAPGRARPAQPPGTASSR